MAVAVAHSSPNTRTASPTLAPGTATPPTAAIPSREIPTDFRSSLAAWWSSSGYRDARMAEERLLRRLSYYHPAPPQPTKSWLSMFGASHVEAEAEVPFAPPADPKTGLVATLRHVYIPTPDPHLASERPDERVSSSNSTDSASASSSSKSKHHPHVRKHSKHQDYINTLEISRPEDAHSKEAVVVMHGYAAAHGFFFRNWDAIAQSGAATGRRTYFLDWLGMGLSSRPNPSLLSAPSNAPVEQRVARAEHFFLSSLEAWRESVGVERMVLIGHSLGGYLATAYAIKYPERVSSLILVSPVGIPEGKLATSDNPSGTKGPTGPGGKPFEVDSAVKKSQGGSLEHATDVAEDAAQRELGTPNGTAAPASTNSAESETGSGANGEAKEWQKARQDSALRRASTKFFLWGWDKGLSPFSILRGIGPWGPLLVGKYSSRRFAAQSAEDIRDLHSYIYGTSMLKGSGEFCISHILAPGAYARMPLIHRVEKLKQDLPVTLLYGDNDWMDSAAGEAAAKLLRARGSDANAHIIPHAGHHLYLDNPGDTNNVIGSAIMAAPKLK